MPLYEYTCEACGHRFEDFRAMADRETPAECPRCGGRAPLQLSACAMIGTTRGSGGHGASCAGGGGG